MVSAEPFTAETCPDRRKHTKHPAGYMQHYDWAEEKVKTHRQRKCPTCGLWVIWEPKPERIGRKGE